MIQHSIFNSKSHLEEQCPVTTGIQKEHEQDVVHPFMLARLYAHNSMSGIRGWPSQDRDVIRFVLSPPTPCYTFASCRRRAFNAAETSTTSGSGMKMQAVSDAGRRSASSSSSLINSRTWPADTEQRVC